MENGNMFTNFLCVFYVSINFSCLCRNKPVLLPHYCHKYVCIYIYNGFHLVTKAKIILFIFLLSVFFVFYFIFCMFPTFTVCFVCEFLKFIYILFVVFVGNSITIFIYSTPRRKIPQIFIICASKMYYITPYTDVEKIEIFLWCSPALLPLPEQKGHKVYHLI